MAIALPSKFKQRSTEVFLSGQRRKDPVAGFALGVFLTKAETNPDSLAQAWLDLEDGNAISEFIEDVRQASNDTDLQNRLAFEKEAVDFLHRINANVLEAPDRHLKTTHLSTG